MISISSRLGHLSLGTVLTSLLLCLISRGATSASSVSLSWNPSPDPSVVGYNLYYGAASDDYTNVISVGNATNAVVLGLTGGDTYYFAVTAYDAYGDESDFSNQISYLVPGILTINAAVTPAGAMQIMFPVAVGQNYQLQVSEDLNSWTTILQGSATSNAWVEFEDTQTGLTQRFYRLVFN